MFNGIGLIVILVCVFGSFLLAGGKMEIILHALPHEMMAIGGAAVGSFLIANSIDTVKLALKGLKRSFQAPRWKESDYNDLLALLFSLLSTFRAGGATAIERHLDQPEESPFFARYPRLLADHHLVTFMCDYGLVAHWEDAEQACAIGVHRAIEGYDPEKAQFTTFVNWQLRGELQSLRFRLMTDQRSSAKRVEATTVSLNSVTFSGEGEEASFEALIEDEDALSRVEAGASCYLAEAAMKALIDEYVEHLRAVGIDQLQRRPRAKRLAPARAAEAPTTPVPARLRGLDPADVEKLEHNLARNRELIERRLFDTATLDQLGSDTGITKERIRQITKRAAKTIGELTASAPRFAVMAEQDLPRSRVRSDEGASVLMPAARPVSLLPEPDHARNRDITVTKTVAVDSAYPARRGEDRVSQDRVLISARTPMAAFASVADAGRRSSDS